MSHRDACLLEDSVEEAIVEPTELFRTMPELRRYLFPKRHDDEIGLRALLERADSIRAARSVSRAA